MLKVHPEEAPLCFQLHGGKGANKRGMLMVGSINIFPINNCTLPLCVHISIKFTLLGTSRYSLEFPKQKKKMGCLEELRANNADIQTEFGGACPGKTAGFISEVC